MLESPDRALSAADLDPPSGMWPRSARPDGVRDGRPATSPPPGRRCRELLGQHRRAARAATEATVRSIIVNPDTDPHDYEPTASDARTMAGATARDRQRDRLRQLGLAAARRRPGRGPHRPRRGRGPRPRAPATTRTSGTRPRSVGSVVAAIVAGLRQGSTRRTRRTSPPRSTCSRRRSSPATTSCSPRSVAASPAWRSATARASSATRSEPRAEAAHAAASPNAIAEGTEVSAQDTETVERQARERLIKVWVFNSQNVTPEVAAGERDRRAAAHPDRHDHRDARRPPALNFEQWQVAQLERLLARPPAQRREGRDDDPCRRDRSSGEAGGDGRRGATDLERRRPRDRAGRVRRRARAERRREVDAPAGAARADAARAQARRACSAARPARRNGTIGYLPQRHGFDASTRIRGVDIVRLGLDGNRFGPSARWAARRRAGARRAR